MSALHCMFKQICGMNKVYTIIDFVLYVFKISEKMPICGVYVSIVQSDAICFITILVVYKALP